MVNEIHGFRYELCDVFRVTLAILCAGDVIVFRACEIIVQRNDLVALGDEAPAKIGADESGSAGNENGFHPLSLHGLSYFLNIPLAFLFLLGN